MCFSGASHCCQLLGAAEDEALGVLDIKAPAPSGGNHRWLTQTKLDIFDSWWLVEPTHLKKYAQVKMGIESSPK